MRDFKLGLYEADFLTFGLMACWTPALRFDFKKLSCNKMFISQS